MQVLFQEVQSSMEYQKIPDFTEICRFGKDTMLSRMFQMMEKFHAHECMVAEDRGDTVTTRRIKAYAATTSKGKMMPYCNLPDCCV